MANKFDFDFVQSKNLNLKFFPVSQASVTFTVTGANDPLTLQLMRDAVQPEFVKTQKKINDFILSRAGEVKALSFNQRRQKKDEQLIDAGNQAIQRFLAEFKKTADEALDAFQRKQAEKEKKIAAAPGTAATGLKWLISVGWTLYQGSKAVADVWGVEGPLKIYDGIMGFVEALKDMYGLVVKLQGYFQDEKTVNARVRASLKSITSKKTFTEADAKSLEELVNLYESKVLHMEMTAKSLSAKITHAIVLVPEDGIIGDARTDAHRRLDEILKGLVALQTALKPVEKQLLKYKLYCGAAKAHCKKEAPSSWTSWSASKAYEFKDTAFSAWEKKFEDVAKDIAEKSVDFLIKRFSVPENVVVKL